MYEKSKDSFDKIKVNLKGVFDNSSIKNSFAKLEIIQRNVEEYFAETFFKNSDRKTI